MARNGFSKDRLDQLEDKKPKFKRWSFVWLIIALNIVIILCIFDIFRVVWRATAHYLLSNPSYSFHPSVSLRKSMRKRSCNDTKKRLPRSIELHHPNWYRRSLWQMCLFPTSSQMSWPCRSLDKKTFLIKKSTTSKIHTQDLLSLFLLIKISGKSLINCSITKWG